MDNISEEDFKNWSEFESMAIRKLDDYGLCQNFIGLAINPSFQERERISVSNGKNEFTWTYAVWDREANYKRFITSRDERLKIKFGKSTPEIKIIKGVVDKSFYEETEKQLENLKLKALVNIDSFGCDGTDFTIFIGGFYRKSSFSWWENLPDEWKDLEIVFKNLYNNLEIARSKCKE